MKSSQARTFTPSVAVGTVPVDHAPSLVQVLTHPTTIPSSTAIISSAPPSPSIEDSLAEFYAENPIPVQNPPPPFKPHVDVVDKVRYRRCVTVQEFCETNKRYSYGCKGAILIPPYYYVACFFTAPLGTFFSIMFFRQMAPVLPIYLLAIDIFVFLIVMVALFVTTFRDPGLMPRYKRVAGDPYGMAEARDQYGELWKFCPTCHIWRPPRSKHCKISDACIYMYDHHCPWVGNAIGTRNFLSFIIFVGGTIVWIGMMYAQVSLYVVFKNNQGHPDTRSTTFFAVGVGCIGLIFSYYFIDTIRTNSRGLTTNEARLKRYEYEDKHSNICVILFRRFRKQPSQILYNTTNQKIGV